MSALLPVRHPNLDFFICDLADAAPKDDIGSMEHPMFALKAGDTNIRRYEHNGNVVEVIPSVKGLATIHDKDVLIFCTSQLMEAANKAQPISRTVRLRAHDLLVSTNRQTSGEGYRLLGEALDRLAGTRLTTNISAGRFRTKEGFGLIEGYKTTERSSDGRMLSVEVTLSEWLFRAITGREVLTISRDYFRLRKPAERRLYEIARKHCGGQTAWKCSLALLHKKMGTTGSLRKFRGFIQVVAEHQHLPDYVVAYDAETDVVGFQTRGGASVRLEVLKEDEEQAFRAEWEHDHPDAKWPGLEAARQVLRAGS